MAMNNSLAEVHPELVSEWSEKNLLFHNAPGMGKIKRMKVPNPPGSKKSIALLLAVFKQ